MITMTTPLRVGPTTWSSVPAVYACTDRRLDGGGLLGTVPDGVAISTATQLGEDSFSVFAMDVVGNLTCKAEPTRSWTARYST